MKLFLARLCVAAVVGIGACAASAADAPLFATVNGTPITLEKYNRVLVSGARNRFYHGTPPEAQMLDFRREVGKRLIEEHLLATEAARRGIEPDEAWVRDQLALFDERLGDDPQWRQERESLVPGIRDGLEDQSRIDRLLESVRQVSAPTQAQLRAFYDDRRELFTQPEQTRVSMILLKVPPWASAEMWDAARAEAVRLVERIRSGASFAELARLHSQDASAESGGDLGAIHAGMLGQFAQLAIDALEPGEVSEPVNLLEGVAIFRLEERLPPTVTSFEEVRERAEGLWRREQQEEAEQRLRGELVTSADIVVQDDDFRAWWASEMDKLAASRRRGQ